MKDKKLFHCAATAMAIAAAMLLSLPFATAQQPASDRLSVASFSWKDQGNGLFLFRDESRPAAKQWQWRFGDGQTSSEQHPQHTFTAPGDYEVCLTTTTPGGSDTTCSIVRVVLLPRPDFVIQNLGHGLYLFQDRTPHNPTLWEWDFGDGRQSREQSPRHHYLESGSYQVRLRVANAAGYSEEVRTLEVQIEDDDRLPSGLMLRVFPRTVFNWLDLQLDRTSPDPVHIQFIAPNGTIMQEVWMQDEFLINMKDWPPGTYYYQIYDHLGHHVGGGKVRVGADETT